VKSGVRGVEVSVAFCKTNFTIMQAASCFATQINFALNSLPYETFRLARVARGRQLAATLCGTGRNSRMRATYTLL